MKPDKRTIDAAKQLHSLSWISPELKSALENDFPELKESEDEKIREAIEGAIRVYGKTQGKCIIGYDMDTLVIRLREAFGALEKQK